MIRLSEKCFKTAPSGFPAFSFLCHPPTKPWKPKLVFQNTEFFRFLICLSLTIN